MEKITYIVSGISLPPQDGEAVAFTAAEKKLARVGLRATDATYSVYRRSVDARKKHDVRLVYSIAARGCFPRLPEHKQRQLGIVLETCGTPRVASGTEKLACRPVIVGTGPAGLFCALLLAENGYAPLLLERGGSVGERKRATERFRKERVLDTENNIQFGAGGAGTFSDGKLVTRVNDPLSLYVLDTFCRFGAPSSIKIPAKPHIGTDILETVIENMLERICSLGGEVCFHTRVEGLIKTNGRVTALQTSRGDIPCGLCVLAIGNSARDTYETLIRDGYQIEPKPFSVGVRIEHLQSDIDRAMYGDFAEGYGLPHAEYTLSANTDTRGVYTFCMCPGGEVVAATSEEGAVVVNGMSRHARDGRNANSAVAVSVFREDYGNDPLQAIAFQREIERAAFRAGGSDYAVPLTTVGDFLSGTTGTNPSRITPTYMGGAAYKLTSPDLYLPAFVTQGLRDGIRAFDRKICGFAAEDAVLSGAETRTSAPLRILRSETRLALFTDNLYPCGEGAGYAGGISSAAIDGIHTAEKIIMRYRPYEDQ